MTGRGRGSFIWVGNFVNKIEGKERKINDHKKYPIFHPKPCTYLTNGVLIVDSGKLK